MLSPGTTVRVTRTGEVLKIVSKIEFGAREVYWAALPNDAGVFAEPLSSNDLTTFDRDEIEVVQAEALALAEVGEIRPVLGGHGLMRVEECSLRGVRMRGHGPAHSSRWFAHASLGAPVGAEAVLKEHTEARARRVDCNNPDCWCAPIRQGRVP